MNAAANCRLTPPASRSRIEHAASRRVIHPAARVALAMRRWLAPGTARLAGFVLAAALSAPTLAAGGERISPSFANEAISEVRTGRATEIVVVFNTRGIQQDPGALNPNGLPPSNGASRAGPGSGRFATLKADFASRYPANEVQFARDYSHLPIALLRVGSEPALRRLMDDPLVLGISRNEILQHFLAQSLPLIQQPAVAGAGHQGQGTTVVVIDSGVNYTRPEFGSCTSPGVPTGCRVVYAADIAADDGQLDDDGHGTNVSAIVAAVAPSAKLAVLDVFGPSSASLSDVIAGINWAIANQATYNIVAINMSLGTSTLFTSPITNPADSFKSAIDNARAAGILTVAASGNSGSTTGLSSPAAVDTAISVGAVYDSAFGSITWSSCGPETTAADKVTCFSNSASFLTMLAPGALINAGGITMGGTSQASPHVAGGVAVVRAAFPGESLAQAIARLRDAATVTDPRNGIATPRLDLDASVGGAPPVSGQGRMLVPDGTSLSDDFSAGAEQWFRTRLEAGKGYSLEVVDTDGDLGANAMGGITLFEADGTTPLQNASVVCGVEAIAPALAGGAGAGGVRCSLRPLVGAGFGWPKVVSIRVTQGSAASFRIRVRESTLYSRWSTNGYDMHVELQNTSAFPAQAQVLFYPDSGGPDVLAIDNLTVPAYGAAKVVRPAGSLPPANKGTLRVIPQTGGNFIPGQINLNAYGFNTSVGQYLFFKVDGANSGGQNSW